MTQWWWDPDTYLELMSAEIPAFVELQEQTAAATEGATVAEMLELGIGTGETARRVRAVHPAARLTAIDSSAEMLDRARSEFPDADLRLARLEDALPDGPFDLVYSSLAVHHLDGPGKRDLFGRVAAALRPGGVFVLADVIVPEDPEDQQTPIDGDYDRPDRLDDQLGWLREAGFEATPAWVHKDLAVVRAWTTNG
jgi:tRNA (cmo5U34)-methyltransferase